MVPIRYQGATQADIGTGFGTAIGYGTVQVPRNHVIQFQGQLYAVGNDGIYIKDDPSIQTGTWTRTYTFAGTPQTDGTATFTGLYHINDGGTASLIMAYSTTAGTNIFRIVTFDGSSWSETGNVTGGGGQGLKAEIVYRNQLHVLNNQSGTSISTMVMSPAGTIGTPTHPFEGGDSPAFCIFNDRLFALYYDSGIHGARLAEYTGTWNAVSTIWDIGGTPRTYNYGGGASALITDGTSMFAFFGINSPSGTQKCIEIDSALVGTDITGAVIPGALTSLSFPEPGTSHWMCVYDTNTNPGSSQPWLYYSSNNTAGTAWTVFEFVDNATTLIVRDTGGDVAHSLPTEVAGGERIWTAGELDIKITGVTPAIGGEEVSFMAFGDAGSADKTVTFQWSNAGEPTTSSATLVGAATGGSASRSGNSVINVDADGTTTYTIVWDTVTDSPGARAQLGPVISA
jgi:hypothetical protein